jgi:hypothetical protein
MKTSKRYAVVVGDSKILKETNSKAEAVRYAKAMSFYLRADVRTLDRQGLTWVK